MKFKLIAFLLAGAAVAVAGSHYSTSPATVAGQSEKKSLATFAREATATNPAHAESAIAALRAAGADGLKALAEVYAPELATHAKPSAPGKAARDESWERIRAAFDAVGQQRDCHASKLFWFTDLEKAKAAAQQSGKPILSLRLLGKLNEEYSCANSRFFRTTLYANAEVAKYLSENFVLHWQSVRPVPRITIDMGDGRKIERTITGNSIHYVLDAAGNPIDALPGLYAAKAFLAGLERARTAERALARLNDGERAPQLKKYHETRLAEIQQQWARDLAQVGAAAATPVSYLLSSLGSSGNGLVVSSANPDALQAGRVPIAKAALEMPVLQKSMPAQPNSGDNGAAVKLTADAIAALPRALSKGLVESPLLRAGAQSSLAPDRARLEASSDEAVWQKIAVLHADAARLDAGATRLVSSKQSQADADKAMRASLSKSFVETPMMRVIRNLERSIAEDTVRNEYLMHTKILEWFIAGSAPRDVDALNRKVYAELFLTPDSDPWLGLAPADTFSALENGGLFQTSTH